jgi:hypothetical protein
MAFLFQTILLVMVSMGTFAQTGLDTSKYFLVRKNTSTGSTIFIASLGANQDSITVTDIPPGRYIVATAAKTERFSIDEKGLMNDTLVMIQNASYKDSTITLLRHSNIIAWKRFINNKIQMEVQHGTNFKNYTLFDNDRIQYMEKQVLVKGALLSVITHFYPNGRKYFVKDQLKQVDSMFYETGKIKRVEHTDMKFLKEFDEKGNLQNYTYQEALANSIPEFQTVTDRYLNNQLQERVIKKFENQTTTIRFRKGKVYEKELVTLRDNGYEEIVELYNPQGKKIKIFTRERGRQVIDQQ